MIEIDKLLTAARRGQDVKTEDLIAWLKSFDHLILRGAGAFGSEIGRKLLELQIPKSKMVYWDVRAEELVEVNGIKVSAPYLENYDSSQTLIINCIPNGSLAGHSMLRELEANGYNNSLSGMSLYEAVFCPMDTKAGFNPKYCLTMKSCNWCCCERLMSVLQKDCKTKRLNNFEDELYFHVATFVLGQKCTLQCKHCGQYIGSFSSSERVNFPFERIKKDIDIFFAAVDSIGFVSLIGGEPFLHPDLNKIVDLVLEKDNFGVLGITTNGICTISSDHLAKLRNERTRVIFSNYCESLSQHRKRIFDDNVSKVKEAGINFSVGVPLWATPPSLVRHKISQELKIIMKRDCHSVKTCQTIRNGVYYPCATAVEVREHHVADYPLDYVVLEDASSPLILRNRIKEVNERLYYLSCEHCADGGEQLPCPGEQGSDERYLHLKA